MVKGLHVPDAHAGPPILQYLRQVPPMQPCPAEQSPSVAQDEPCTPVPAGLHNVNTRFAPSFSTPSRHPVLAREQPMLVIKSQFSEQSRTLGIVIPDVLFSVMAQSPPGPVHVVSAEQNA